MEQLNANDLYYTNLIRKEELNEEYNKIMNDCNEQIISAYQKNRNSIQFEVPNKRRNIVNYNMVECICHIMIEQRKKNFYVRYIEPNFLYIEFSDKEKEAEYKNKQKFLMYESLKSMNMIRQHKTLSSLSITNRAKNNDELLDYNNIDKIPMLEYNKGNTDNRPKIRIDINSNKDNTFKDDTFKDNNRDNVLKDNVSKDNGSKDNGSKDNEHKSEHRRRRRKSKKKFNIHYY